MKQVSLYHLKDVVLDNFVFENVTSADLASYLNISIATVTSNARFGNLINDRYLIIDTGEKFEDYREFISDWSRLTTRFHKKVEWVRETPNSGPCLSAICTGERFIVNRVVC